MDHIIQTGTDGEGNAILTTLDCQISVTWTYTRHETRNFGDLENVVNIVFLNYTATDTNTENATYLQEGVSSQTVTGTFAQPFYPSDKYYGNPNTYTGVLSGWTPHANLTEDQMKQWVIDILEHDNNFRLDTFKNSICIQLYGQKYSAPAV